VGQAGYSYLSAVSRPRRQGHPQGAGALRHPLYIPWHLQGLEQRVRFGEVGSGGLLVPLDVGEGRQIHVGAAQFEVCL